MSARAVERFCVRIKATAVCSARSEQCHVHRSNRTIPVVVEPRTPIIVGQTGCEIDCATRHILDAALETLLVDGDDVHLELTELAFIDVGGATSLVLWASRLPNGRRVILHDPPYELTRIIDMLWGQPATIEVDPP